MKRFLLSLGLIFLMGTGGLFAQDPTVQAIYSVADPELAVVDFYATVFGLPLPGFPSPILDDVPYPTVTSTISSPIAGLPLNLAIAPGNSTSINDTIKSFTVVLDPGKNFLAAGAGVSDPAQFKPNPDGRDIEVNAFIIDNSKLASDVEGEVQFTIIHTVTDAPTVDVRISGGATLVQDLAYGDFSEYISLAPGQLTLEVVDPNNQLLGGGTFTADLSTFADSALVVVLSGFLDPAANQNGPEFNIFGGTRGGNDIAFQKTVVGIDDGDAPVVKAYRLEQNYPNPFNPSTTIEFSLPVSERVTLAIYDLTGKRVETLVDGRVNSGIHQVTWNAGNRPSGVYFYQLQTDNFTQTRKLMLLK